TTLRYLRTIFPYCTCTQRHHVKCLNAHIGKCLGICCLKNPDESEYQEKKKQYKKNIQSIRSILEGKKNSLVKKLGKEMHAAAHKESFEDAIAIRTKIEKIQRVFENAVLIGNAGKKGLSPATITGLQALFDLPE